MKKICIFLFLFILTVVFTVGGLRANSNNKLRPFYETPENIIQTSDSDTHGVTGMEHEDIFQREKMIEEPRILRKEAQLGGEKVLYSTLSRQEIDNSKLLLVVERDGYKVIYNEQSYFIPIEEIESADFCLDIFSDYKVLEEIKEILYGGI